jgi:hypothetical protein
MKCGFNHALYMMSDFWKKYEPGIKDFSLHTYKGVKLVLEKLIESKNEFFLKGEEVDLIFTREELDTVRKGNWEKYINRKNGEIKSKRKKISAGGSDDRPL